MTVAESWMNFERRYKISQKKMFLSDGVTGLQILTMMNHYIVLHCIHHVRISLLDTESVRGLFLAF